MQNQHHAQASYVMYLNFLFYHTCVGQILTKQLKLMVCVKTHSRNWKVLLRNSPETDDAQHLQRGVDFVSAFVKGFSIQDALAIVRIDGIYVESFHIADVRQRLRVSVLNSKIQ